MSCVTSIILTSRLDDSGFLRLIALLEAIDPEYSFNQVDQLAAGARAMQADIWMGAFNYLDMPQFRACVRLANWDYPDSLRIFVQAEHEEFFSPVDVFTHTAGLDPPPLSARPHESSGETLEPAPPVQVDRKEGGDA